MEKTVYVVHCVDTEGPLHESIEATFERVKDIFGFDLEPSCDTLKKLQKKELDLGGKEGAVADLVAPIRISFNDTWDKIDAMLDKICSEKFRKKHCDSFGNGWIFNWFCVDHVGFEGENPRRRDIGYHNILRHYHSYLKQNKITCDKIHWHYHPPAIISDAHRSGTTYLNSSNLFKILARRVIDMDWFPTVNRPGFHVERPDSHWFLEQWIPFDYGNQATKDDDNVQPDMARERFGDWRKAPSEWRPYYPDFYDYQKKGSCNRLITRCLNMESRIGMITSEDIRDAFKEANENGNSLLSFTNHDERDMAPEIGKIWGMLVEADKEFPDVKFKFVDAVEGIRKIMGLKDFSPPDFDVSLERKDSKAVLTVKAKNPIFGPQPFLAIKTRSKQYFWENFDFLDDGVWTYTFDYNNIEIDAVEKIGVASNTQSGVAEVVVLDVASEELRKNVINLPDEKQR